MALLGNLTGSSQFFNPNNFYNGTATQSLRFDDGSSAYLSKTPSSASNRRTWTWSSWLKVGNIPAGQTALFSARSSSTDQCHIWYAGAYIEFESGNSLGRISTSGVLRDPSAWYHIVVTADTTNATAADRVIIYINGERQAVATTTAVVENAEFGINLNIQHRIGSQATENNLFLDGYLSEVNFIDGQALTPTSFGETKNGVWVAKDTSGLTFGTNGFRLQFDQTGVGTASTSTIGADTSGNTNHWTSSGIAASDCAMPDSPENNFATFNGLITTNSGSLSEGNLKSNSLVGGSSKYGANGSTFLVKSGKWYAEMLMIGGTITATFSGAVTYRNDSSTRIGSDIAIVYTTLIYSNGGIVQSSLSGISAGDVFGFAVDVDNKTCQVYKNGSTYGSQIDWSGNTYADNGFSGLGHGHGSSLSNSTIAVNYGQDSSFAGNKTSGSENAQDGNGIGDFYYAPPSGFLALCTANLPEPTIGPNSATQADDYFNTLIYDGNDDATRTFDVGFVSDWSWFKARNADGIGHQLYDSSRGVTKYLASNTTGAEATNTEGVTSFNSSGLLAIGNSNFLNKSGRTHVLWNWKANGGTTSSNTDGSLTSTVQANTTAGFSIVTYTGTGSTVTIGHGLGSVPKMIIIKNRGDANAYWAVYHGANTSAPETDYLVLNTTAATADGDGFWNDTAPTSSVFTVASNNTVNRNTYSHVAYCFAEIEGYSKFGSYTANNSTDGTFIYLGFRPAWVMFKRTAGNAWGIKDSARSPINPLSNVQEANEDNADYTTGVALDFVSNGIKHRNDSGYFNNVAGDNFIYMAFAEAPFKYANAR